MTPPTEERLRAALDAYADRIDPDPEAYARARAVWQRRERRRRLLVVAVAVVLVALADVVGLWALNRADSGSPVVFDGPAPARLAPAPDPEPAPAAPRRGYRLAK